MPKVAGEIFVQVDDMQTLWLDCLTGGWNEPKRFSDSD